MSTVLPGLTPHLSAEIFATLALRLSSSETFVSGDRLGLVLRGSGAASTLETGRLESILADQPGQTVSSFLNQLSSGRLHDHHYRTEDGSYLTGSGPILSLPVSEIIARQEPTSSALRAPAESVLPREISLTVPWIFLENLPRIGALYFVEAAFRALGGRVPESNDVLWLHAGEGEVGSHAVSSAIVLSESPPQVSALDYENHPYRFPVVCLDFERGWWRVYPHRAIGRPEIKDRILPLLPTIADGIAIAGTPRPRRGTPAQPPPKKRPAPRPARKRTDPTAWPLTEIFSRPDPEMLLKGRPGVIAVTQVGIPVVDLKLVSGFYFHLALRWCLGVRDPREGDRAVVTAGQGFTRKGKVRDCLLVCPSIPSSRRSDHYPKIQMEFREGRWTVLPQETNGRGAEELMVTILGIEDWDLEK